MNSLVACRNGIVDKSETLFRNNIIFICGSLTEIEAHEYRTADFLIKATGIIDTQPFDTKFINNPHIKLKFVANKNQYIGILCGGT